MTAPPPPPPPPVWVGIQDQLIPVVEALRGAPRIALDTEFHAERRYAPELMLVQLALPDGRSWVLDGRVLDLRPLGAALCEAEWVVHCATFDVPLLVDATGARPRHVWDTQILAAFLGFDYPLRLDLLAGSALGLTVDKGASLTDWTQRPLSDAQLRYAAADATVTLALMEVLRERLPADRRAAALAASDELARESLVAPDPNRGWLNLDVATDFSLEVRRVLDALCTWREAEARNHDQPAFYLLSDGIALDLARRRPTTMSALLENRRLPPALAKRHGGALLQQIQAALRSSAEPPAALTRDQLRLARTLPVWALALEDELGVAARLLMPPELARRVAMQGVEAWTGWRQDLAGRSLEQFLTGGSCIRINHLKPVLS